MPISLLTYTYNAAGRLVEIEHRDAQSALLARYAYTLDGVGNRVQVEETLAQPIPAPQAGFVGAPLSGTAPLTVAFTDLSTGTITSHLWAFGDEITSSLHSPTHVYDAAGVYTVGLEVSGPGGTDVETKPGYVEALPQPTPTPTPAPTPTPGPCPVEQSLGEQSTGTESYRALRDDVFARSAAGRRYTALYQEHRGEVARLLARDPRLAARAAGLLREWQPAVEGLAAMKRGAAVSTAATQRRVSAVDVAQAEAVLQTLAERGSPELQADLEPVLLRLDDFAGHTPAEIWALLEEGARERVYLPVVLRRWSGGAGEQRRRGAVGRRCGGAVRSSPSPAPSPTRMIR